MVFNWYQSDFLSPTPATPSPVNGKEKGKEKDQRKTKEDEPSSSGSMAAFLEAVIAWLPEEKRSAIAVLAEEPSLDFAYAYDWTPNPKPGL